MKAQSSSTRIWLIVVAILLLGGVIAYVVGGAREHAARLRDSTQSAAALQTARTRLAACRSVNQLLAADAWTYRAAAALDNRNFGVAGDAMAKVEASLNRLDPAAAGVGDAAVARVRSEAAAVRISVAQNLEAQRGQVIQLAADIGALADQAMAKRGDADS
jgi:hypothetical protein